MSPSPNEIEFDPTTPEFEADPYQIYAELRSSSELPYFEGFNSLLVSKYKDIQEILLNRTMVRSMTGIFTEEEIANEQRKGNWHDMPYHSRFVQFSLLDSEGSVHNRLRKLVFDLFTPGAIAGLRESIESFVDDRLTEIGSGDFDFIEDFAAAIPGHVIGKLLGVPAEDRSQLRVWSERIVQFFDFDRSDERKEIAESTTKTFYLYLKDLQADRQKNPRDDLVSRLVGYERAGLLNEDEFISTCMLILMAGHGSTLDVMGTGLYNLVTFSSQMHRLREDPRLIDTAVQEMFRFDPPLPFFHRYNTEQVELGGKKHPAGNKFGLLYGSANRDPDQFDNPDSFDIGRSPNRHLAFGGGSHFCLGNHLARLNMSVVFLSLLRHFQNIELIDERPAYKPGLSVRGMKHLNISVERS